MIEAAEHLTILLEESIQRVVPVTSSNPLSITVELELVLKVTSLDPEGVKIAEPEALKGWLEETNAPPLKVESPVKVLTPDTERLLLIVVVPDVAPRLSVVASPPIERLATVVLKMVAVSVVEVISEDPA